MKPKENFEFQNVKKKQEMKNVAIIGGGISGLISIKCCLEAGLNPTCFEMTTDIGGLWNFDQNAVEGKASVMKSTVINTSKEFMAFSDFPPPEEFPNFMHNRKLLEYFRMYADRFQLVQYVRFSRRVTRIEPDENYEQKGSWKIVSIDAKSSNEENPTIETFDAVLLATGHHATPKSIDFPGLKQFKGIFCFFSMNFRFLFFCQGQIMHSWEYKKPTGFEDKNVLVVGIGNSGGDVVVELSRIAKQVRFQTDNNEQSKEIKSITFRSIWVHVVELGFSIVLDQMVGRAIWPWSVKWQLFFNEIFLD